MQQWLFVDGSGKPHQGKYIAYCGYLSTPEGMEQLFDTWNRVLEEEQIPYLSMKEAQSWHGAWELKRQQWGSQADEMRRSLILRLAETVVSARVFGFGFGVNSSAFRAKQIEPSEYYLFVRILEMLSPAMQGFAAVSIVVDEEESYAEQIYRFFRRLRREKPQISSMIKLIGIGDDRAIPGLQAADLLAHATVGELRRREERPADPPDELHERLTHGTNSRPLFHEHLFDDPGEFLKIAGIR